MSTAELTARRVYQEYNLGQLSDDVKRQLMILFLTNTEEVSEVDTKMEVLSKKQNPLSSSFGMWGGESKYSTEDLLSDINSMACDNDDLINELLK